MAEVSLSVTILAGPNGAGKTTAASFLLRDVFAVDEFVNADDIARGLSGFEPEHSAFAAGRLMLKRMRSLAIARSTFAFETTLASRSFAPWLADLARTGYRIGLLYLFVPNVQLCVDRVRQRVREGGHDVPEAVVRRRYDRGLSNLFGLYMPLADDWGIYDNSGRAPRRIVEGRRSVVSSVHDQAQWLQIKDAGGR